MTKNRRPKAAEKGHIHTGGRFLGFFSLLMSPFGGIKRLVVEISQKQEFTNIKININNVLDSTT